MTFILAAVNESKAFGTVTVTPFPFVVSVYVRAVFL